MKPLIKKYKGTWMVCGYRGCRSKAHLLKAVDWCHTRNLTEGNYR